MRYVVILAGGTGTRLWPLSRAGRPKQLLSLAGGRSLLELAYERAARLVPAEHVYVCSAAAHTDAIAALLPHLPPGNILGEPMARDTAAAIAVSGAVVGRHDPDAVVATITADHLISPADEFAATVSAGFEWAEWRPQSLVTFGVTPTHAHTGLGYVETGEPVTLESCEFLPSRPAYRVARFTEKPEAVTAESYLASGRHLWNSGMFVWRPATLLAAMDRLLPATADGARQVAETWDSPSAESVLSRVYPQLKRISIDYAVLEPLTGPDRAGLGPDLLADVVTLPLDVTWLDIGSFAALGSTYEPDDDGNAYAAPTLCCLVDSSNNVVISDQPGHLIAAVGLHDHLVVHTSDITLVCPLAETERIKGLVTEVTDRCGPRFG